MPRLPLTDLLHRGLVTSLVGLAVWGIVGSVSVHQYTIQRGKGLMAARDAAVLRDQKEEENEIALAEAAQAVLHSKQ